MEITKTGKIEKWTENKAGIKQSDGKPWVKTSFKIENDDEYYGFFSPDGTANPLNKLKESFPVGTLIQWKMWKKQEDDKYWKFKKESLSILKDQTQLTKPTQPINSNNNNNNNTQQFIIRQNALSHADSLIKLIIDKEIKTFSSVENLMKYYFEIAKHCENWVNGTKYEYTEIITNSTINVTEEVIRDGN